jgi:hypothetical protein
MGKRFLTRIIVISKRTVFLCALVLVVIAAFCSPALSRATEPQKAQAFDAQDINGTFVRVDVPSYTGRPVVLHFWSTDDLEAIISEFHKVKNFAENNPKIHVIMVHHWGDKEKAKILMSAVNKIGLENIQMVLDENDKAAVLYDLPRVFMTATYFINHKGQIQVARMGVLDWDMPALKGIIKDLFK